MEWLVIGVGVILAALAGVGLYRSRPNVKVLLLLNHSVTFSEEEQKALEKGPWATVVIVNYGRAAVRLESMWLASEESVGPRSQRLELQLTRPPTAAPTFPFQLTRKLLFMDRFNLEEVTAKIHAAGYTDKVTVRAYFVGSRGRRFVSAAVQLPLDGSAVIDIEQFNELQRALAYVRGGAQGETVVNLIFPQEESFNKVTNTLRRDVAQFSVENDHNPYVLEDCPDCLGSGVEGGGGLKECTACAGRGFTGRLARYFQQHPFTEAPIVDVVASPRGEVACPGCGGSFTLSDRARWTGLRHVTCGQKLRVTHESSTLNVER